MGETILLVVLIVVLFLITISSVIAMVKLRGKTNSVNTERIDAGFDICISELNKMGSLIKSDIDSKYKEILFLYDLIEDKHKQIEALVNQTSTRQVIFEPIVEQQPEPFAPEPFVVESDIPRPIKPNHKAIIQMNERGFSVADIAKELGIGQGEVQLILSIAGK